MRGLRGRDCGRGKHGVHLLARRTVVVDDEDVHPVVSFLDVAAYLSSRFAKVSRV